MNLTAVEVTNWLCECSDKEFTETFALMEIAMLGRGIPTTYNAEIIILNMDVNCICNRIRDILKENQRKAEDGFLDDF